MAVGRVGPTLELHWVSVGPILGQLGIDMKLAAGHTFG